MDPRDTTSSPQLRGMELLHDPQYNKGTAFTEEERDHLGLRGLLPPHVATMEEQEQRALGNLARKQSDIERYIFLLGLQDRNETLFYRLLIDNIEALMPIVYTPTVGEACRQYAHIFRRSRGLYITAEDRGRVRQILENWPEPRVRVIVVTDGERILGLGDLGANGMGIPVGKLALYSALAGVHPSLCLPIMLDVGTDNETLLRDPLYLGLVQTRVRGDAYDELIEELVTESQHVFPGVLIQFEDFGNRNAFPLLQRYRDRVPSFNDDMQGTAAVSLAGLLAAVRIVNGGLADQRILFFGAGSASRGTADLIAAALVQEGLSETEARRRCWLMDSKGLVVASRSDLQVHKRAYAHDHAKIDTLLDAVTALRPTALIGVSGQPNQFTQPVVEAMSAINHRPIIFALSNPTSNAECTAEECYRWSNGEAVFASGSPFAPVELRGRRFVPGQGNNAYIFPGVGLATVATGIRRVTDEMFLEAARTLAHLVSDDDLAHGSLFPPLSTIRDVSREIAVAVCRVAYRHGLASLPEPRDLESHIRSHMYEPVYREIE